MRDPLAWATGGLYPAAREDADLEAERAADERFEDMLEEARTALNLPSSVEFDEMIVDLGKELFEPHMWSAEYEHGRFEAGLTPRGVSFLRARLGELIAEAARNSR